MAASKSGQISVELKHRLIRGTDPTFCRYPTTQELEEMAKSLVIVYPCLKDVETIHVSFYLCIKIYICSLLTLLPLVF